jgi:hypothetical protein
MHNKVSIRQGASENRDATFVSKYEFVATPGFERIIILDECTETDEIGGEGGDQERFFLVGGWREVGLVRQFLVQWLLPCQRWPSTRGHGCHDMKGNRRQS